MTVTASPETSCEFSTCRFRRRQREIHPQFNMALNMFSRNARTAAETINIVLECFSNQYKRDTSDYREVARPQKRPPALRRRKCRAAEAMTATQIDRVRSDNSVSERHPNANETAGTAPEHDPQTAQLEQYANQQSGVTTRSNTVESRWLLRGVDNCLEWLDWSHSNQLPHSECPTLGLSNADRDSLARRVV